jgi:acyl-CoA thioester hydrolase
MDINAMRALGTVPVVRRHTITYHKPALLGQELEVSTQIVEAKGLRAKRHNEVRQAATGVLLVEAETDWVWVDAQTGRPKPVPEAIMQAFGWT